MSSAHAQTPITVLYSFPHVIGAPGIGWTAWNQVAELIAGGHDVTLVAAGIGRALPGLHDCITTLHVGRFRIPHRLIGRDRAFRHHDRVAAARVANGGFDVVHTWPLGGTATLAAARRSGAAGVREAPNTHTAHAFDVSARLSRELGIAQHQGAAHTFDARHLAVEEQEWASATAVLVPSEPVARSFVQHGIGAGRLLRHRYGHRVAPDDRPRGKARPFTAVFLGRGEPRKGLHVALEAWSRSTASETGRFLVHGRIEPEYRTVLGSLLRAPGVEEAGFTDDPIGVLRQADVLLLPSFEEGSALVTYEAQAAGCVPLVSTAAGAVLEHEVQGLVHEPGDIATLARQLDDLTHDDGHLERLRAASLAHAPSLTWAVAAERLASAYGDAIRIEQTVPTGPHDVCVVVCSRDRDGMLREALEAIRASTPAAVEILVVDSGSRTAGTIDAAEAACVRVVRSDVPGLSIARNAGWRSTNRQIVVYTDDDCRPQPGWIDRVIEAFGDPVVAGVSGRMLAQEHRAAPPPYHRPAKYTTVASGLDAGHGALMAFRRRTLERLGGFDDTLGAGRHLSGAEDLDMFCRVIADGGIVVHRADAVVVHENTRLDDAYVRLLAGYGRGLGGLFAKWLRLRPATGATLVIRVIRRSGRRIVRPGTSALFRQAELAELRGAFHGGRSMRRAPLRLRLFSDTTPPPPVRLPLKDEV